MRIKVKEMVTKIHQWILWNKKSMVLVNLNLVKELISHKFLKNSPNIDKNTRQLKIFLIKMSHQILIWAILVDMTLQVKWETRVAAVLATLLASYKLLNPDWNIQPVEIQDNFLHNIWFNAIIWQKDAVEVGLF